MYDDLFKSIKEILYVKHIDVKKVSQIRYELAEARADALKELFEARPQLLRPKDKDVTDLDRKTQLEGWTAEKERSRQFLDDLWVILSDLIHSDKDSREGR